MAEADDAPPESAADYLSEIDAALKREDKWRKRGKKVVKRYRDESSDARSSTSKVNILWANTEVLKAATYTRTAKPDVRRRFPDKKKDNGLSRIVAEVMERSVSYAIDMEDVDDPLSAAVDDMLLPGRGIAWVSYEPEIEEGTYGVENDTSGTGAEANYQPQGPSSQGDSAGAVGLAPGSSDVGDGSEPRIASQTLCLDYVYWEDFTHGPGRTWREVPWVARRKTPRLSQFRKQFPQVDKKMLSGNYQLKDSSDDTSETSDKSYVETWELWDKDTKRRVIIARGYPDILQADEDPYRLQGFFPCPRPIYSITATDKLIPVPEYVQYQDQAVELDQISTRITALVDELRWKGVYDGSIDPSQNVIKNLASAGDGTFLPYENWMLVKEKGGIEAAVGFWPMERIIPVLTQLYLQRGQLISTIYEITGISDIMRGISDAKEKLGTQQLKAQFGSGRMQRRQRDVQRFVRDCYRLMGEIIAEHFTQETLAGITGMELPTRAEQTQLKMQLLALAQQAQQQAPAGLMVPPQGGPPNPMMGAGGPPMGQPPAGQGPMGAPPMRGPPPMVGPPQPMPQAPQQPQQPQMPQQQGQPGQPPKMPPQIAAIQEQLTSPTWDDVLEVLRSDKLRGYQVDVETDSTIFADAQQDKQDRIEFMLAAKQMTVDAFTALGAAPSMIPLVKALTMFGVKSFKQGRSLEEDFEDAFEAVEKNPPPAPADKSKPPPQQAAQNPMMGMAQMAEVQRKAARDKADVALESQQNTADNQFRSIEQQRENALAEAEIKQGQAGVVLDFVKQKQDSLKPLNPRDSFSPS